MDGGEYTSLVQPMRSIDKETHCQIYFGCQLPNSAACPSHLAQENAQLALKSCRRTVTRQLLASGSTQQSITASYKLGISTVWAIIMEVCLS